MYNKLFTKILDSSIWLESTPTRIVWLTFIAVMDEVGFVQFAAVGNVANRARVTLDEAQEAIKALEGPDDESGDPDNDGRRIERVPGGWMVLNAQKHRDLVTRAIKQEQTRERVAKHRALKRSGNAPVTPSEADTEARSESKTQSERKTTKSGGVNGRSRRPIFSGQRFVIFDWMLEDLSRILGPHTDAFNLHEWFYGLDARAVAEALVIPKPEQWPWIQAELVAEAGRRGLPVASAVLTAPRKTTLGDRMTAMVAQADAVALTLRKGGQNDLS